MSDNIISGTVHGNVVQAREIHLSAAPLPVPCQLPSTLADFTGRAADLAALDAARGGSTAVVISAIHGTAGVGKTALAIHWAHQVRDKFPDGQLYVNLRGYDPGPPARPDEVLDGFLRALNVPAAQVPSGLDARTALFRALLADRRVLVVLDNANNPEQVRPLLPGSPSCLVVVTSRDSLLGLATTEGATRIALDLLPAAEASALVKEIVGADAEPDAVSEIVRLCARLPLALRIVAHRAHGPLTELVEELAEELLDTLSTGTDERSAVRAVFSWSYRGLPTDQAAMFDLLGVVPGPDVSVHAAAACAGITVPKARRTLRALADAHLVNEIDRDRYGCHDLLRSYARDLADRQDHTEPLRRLVGFYLHTAAAADQLLFPVDNAWHRDGAPAPLYPLELDGHRAALAWFEEERANLIAAVRVSPDRAAWQLAAAMWSFFKRQANTSDVWVEVYELGLAATLRLGDKAGESQMHNCLSDAYRSARRSDEAVQQAEHALRLCRELRDKHGEAAALNNLGTSSRFAKNYGQALSYYRQSLQLREKTRDRFRQAITLNNLGATCVSMERHQEALGYLGKALDIRVQIGDQYGQAVTVNNLGDVHRRLGNLDQAVRHYLRALRLREEIGDRHGLGITLNSLAAVYKTQNRYTEAILLLTRAIRLRRQVGDLWGEAITLNGLGWAHHELGHGTEAGTYWQRAQLLFASLGSDLSFSRQDLS